MVQKGSPLLSCRSVQQPDAQVQVCGKRYPEKVGKQQPAGGAVHLPEGQGHQENQAPEGRQPQEGQAEGLKVEEEDAPEKVEGQLYAEKPETVGTLPGAWSQPDPGGGNAHQGKEDALDDGEGQTGRRQRRLADALLVDSGVVPRQPAGKSTDELWQCDPEGVGFPSRFFHLITVPRIISNEESASRFLRAVRPRNSIKRLL